MERGNKLENEINLNLEQIASDCGLNISVYDDFVCNIKRIASEYSDLDLVKIYNYMLINTTNPDIIVFLIKALDSYRHPSSLELLVDILLLRNYQSCEEDLKEKYIKVRVMTAKAIANYKNTDVVSSLLYCLNNKNENYRVRLACADALGKIGDKYAVTPLINVMSDEEEKSVYLRESAVTALGMLGDVRAIEPLVKILEAKQGIMDKFSFLKERIIEALNKIGYNDDARVYKALKLSLSDASPQVRIDAIEGLMNSDNPESYEIIKDCLLNDDNDEVKKNALVALYNMSDRKILDEVIANACYPDTLKIEANNIIKEYEN